MHPHQASVPALLAAGLLLAAAPAGAEDGPGPLDNPLVWACVTLEGTCGTVEQLYEDLYGDPGATLAEAAMDLVATVQSDQTATWALQRGEASTATAAATPSAVLADADATATEASLAAPGLEPVAVAAPAAPTVDVRPFEVAGPAASEAAALAPEPTIPAEAIEAAEAVAAQFEQLVLVQLPAILLPAPSPADPALGAPALPGANEGAATRPFDQTLRLPLESADVFPSPGAYHLAEASAAAAPPREAGAPAPASTLPWVGSSGAPGPSQMAALALLTGLLLIPPLYHRLQQHRLLDHRGRAQLFQLVAGRPGIHIEELARATGMSRSTAVYHLRLLERHGHLVVMGARKSVHYYPNNGGQEAGRREQLALLASPRVRRVAAVIAARPGVTRNELAPLAGITLSTLSWHLGRLIEAGLVEDRPIGSGLRALHPAAGLAGLLEPWDGASAMPAGAFPPSATAVPQPAAMPAPISAGPAVPGS